MMSAMSASPVKPVLPPTGVNVTPPVVTSPPKIGIPIPPTLTISPAKPANMNHAAMPIGMADHKMPQFPPQSQGGIPAMQPMMPQMPPRAPEKPKDLSAPAALPMKPTSNGMEGLAFPNQQPHMPLSTLAESQVTPSAAHSTKVENQEAEMPESNATPAQPIANNANSVEPNVAAAAPPTEPEPEKKEEPIAAKVAEPVSEASVPPVPATLDVANTTPTSAATSVPPTPPVVPPTATATAPASAKQPTPPPEPAPAPPPVVTPSVSRTEALTHSKPEIKVATIPRQATKRKRDTKVVTATPEVKKEGKDDDRKSKRVRLPTQPYQSPLPELNIIAKINKSTKATPSKAADDKLIVFYKNEFLAVRNAEGGFYVCQTMQNIYKSSSRIRIRWLSQEEGKATYSPDFYDHTDFDCILTNLNLDKVEKEKFKLPQEEQQRTESILKRALDVEKGVSEKPPVTEEHPDGLDLSLYRDESQLKKSKGRSRKKSSGKKADSSKSADSESEGEDDEDDDDDDDDDDEEEEKKAKTESAPKTSRRKKKTAKKKAPPPPEKRSAAKTTSSTSKSSAPPAKKKSETRVGSKRKAPVSTNSQSVEKRARKSDSSSQSSERTNKTRSAEAAAGAKSRRDRRSKARK